MAPDGNSIERLDASSFREDRLERLGIWAVVFLDDHCPFCRELAPRFASLAGAGTYHVGVADVTDYRSALWDDFRLEVVPTVVLFRDGAPFLRRNGRLGFGPSDADLTAVRAALGPA
jgi:thiol-disulfide isomerase/thioredoxin